MKYSGLLNLYIPENASERDDIVFDALKALDNCEWLKGILATVCINQRIGVCSINEIVTSNMTAPRREKFEYYERYYLDNKKMAHSVLVDENNVIQDGYISYLLAQKYNYKVDIMQVVSGKPICKIVCGRHVIRAADGFAIKLEKEYIWRCSIKDPVIPGDVLQVKTSKGKAFMCVDRIDYATGKKFCSKYKKVVRHMHSQI